MRILLATIFGLLNVIAYSQCSVGCDRSNPADANLTVAADEVVCITTSKVFGTIAVNRVATSTGLNGGELRVCGVGTVLEATASFAVFPDQAPWWTGGVIKLFNCGRIIQSGSFSDFGDVAIEAYCTDCGNANYPLDTAIQVTGSKVLTGWVCNTVLPIELVDFSVYKNETDVSLVWTTASELDNDYFEVQVSNDGLTWVTVSLVQGAGTTQEQSTYQFFDDSEKLSKRYYRLKQVDYDGKSSYSAIKVVRFEEEEFLAVYQQGNDVVIELDQKGQSVIHIYDVNGKMVQASQFYNATESGQSRVTFSKEKLSSGVYHLNIYNDGTLQTKKFIISQ